MFSGIHIYIGPLQFNCDCSIIYITCLLCQLRDVIRSAKGPPPPFNVRLRFLTFRYPPQSRCCEREKATQIKVRRSLVIPYRGQHESCTMYIPTIHFIRYNNMYAIGMMCNSQHTLSTPRLQPVCRAAVA